MQYVILFFFLLPFTFRFIIKLPKAFLFNIRLIQKIDFFFLEIPIKQLQISEIRRRLKGVFNTNV